MSEREPESPEFIPYEDWTDEEWLRVMLELPPQTNVTVGEAKVAEWRMEAG
jgi:hypothetical protein